MQVREWVADALYNTSHGYFSKKASPVGQIPQPLPFNTLSGQQAYLQQLRVLYDTLQVNNCNDASTTLSLFLQHRQTVSAVWQVSWLTPAEIFQPHYGHAVAQCILKEHKHEQPLNIIEIGAGSGRLARDILVYSSWVIPIFLAMAMSQLWSTLFMLAYICAHAVAKI